MSESKSRGLSWEDFRSQMPVARTWTYLDHAAVAPISAPARDAAKKWADEAAADGATGWSGWSRRAEEVRQAAARMIGADPGEMALVHNTTTGIGLVAEGLSWRDGDNVVTLANEFPSNLYPWLNLAARGVETRQVPAKDGRIDLAALGDACDARTRIVSASWIGYASGWRNDVDQLAEVAHRHGALLFLDAIQGLGVFPLDVAKTPVDFLAADGHKWLLGPEGAGFLFVRRQHLELLRPTGVGWHSVVHEHDFDRIQPQWKPTAARFEGGSENLVGFIALGASLDLLMSVGIERIGERLLELTDMACARLAAAGATIVSCRQGDRRSGIVSFEWPGGDMAALPSKLRKRDIVLSYRGGRLRVSPHAYNNEQDIETLVESLVHSG